jgi:energy-coupling factor transporter ATP-binding protein EcfA2
MKLTKLKASSLRGLPAGWPEVEIGERGLVVYGPSGTGKSSLIDCIEFVLKGQTTLFAQTRQGVNWQIGAPHIRGGTMSAEITVKNAGREHTIVGGSSPPADVAAWCNQAARSGFVLRRHMLLRFIDTEPRIRYSQIEPFLDLREFLKVETALIALVASAQTTLTTREASRAAKEQHIRTVFGLEQRDAITEAALLAKLNIRLVEAGLSGITGVTNLEATEAKVNKDLGGNTKEARLAALLLLKGHAQRLTLASTYTGLVERLQAALAALEGAVADHSGVVLTDLLIRGKEIIESREEEDCPLCEQQIDRSEVLGRLTERIEADSRITAARASVSETTKAALTPLKSLAAAMKTFTDNWLVTVASPLPAAYAQTTKLLEELVQAIERTIRTTDTLEFTARLGAGVVSHDPVIATLDALIIDEGGGERRQKLSDAKLMVAGLKAEWPACRAASQTVEKARAHRAIISRVLGYAITARKDTVQGLLDDVADIANGLYEKLHPGENIAKSKLVVRPTEDGSVILQTDFYGRVAPPLLHYSEAHLDTLGLCYFLALRRREADRFPEFKVLVLDDVLHSVDARHRTRFASLIKSEFADHQVLVVTHDRIFYDRLRHTFGTAGFNYIALNAWDIDRGPVRGDPSTDLDRILSEEDRLSKSAEELSGAGGRLFEWLLRQLTERLEIAIPARFIRRHDIGNMWPALALKLRRQRYFRESHATLADDLDANGWVRNELGAHYNEPESPVDPQEVRTFAGLLAGLYVATYCNTCGTFIKKYAEHDWRCDCGANGFYAGSAASQTTPRALSSKEVRGTEKV